MAQEIGVRERLAGEVAGQGKLPSSRLRPRLQLAAGLPEYEKIAPVLAFTHSGLFSDPQLAYKMSMEYMEEQERKQEAINAGNQAVGSGGASNRTDTQPQAQG